MKFHGFLILIVVCIFASTASATTYYVKPDGDDSADGQSQDRAWKTCGKVNATPFKPGDTILFQRGGKWRESLSPSSSGAEGNPITYDAFGEGAKPVLFGSDKLDNAKFTPAGEHKWAYPLATQADSALVDGVFIDSEYKNGAITISTPDDPRTSGKLYTACTRGNVIFSKRKDHLVFRNLIVDETAGQLNEGINQGYGVRIEGSTDVLVESCEAYRCGRHNFAVINSHRFVGRNLRAAYVVPAMPGGNTAYVSYADGGAPAEKCTSVWDDIQADHLDDPKGGHNIAFITHGDRLGLIIVKNSLFKHKISFMSTPVAVTNTVLTENGSIENWGKGVILSGVTIVDSAAIDQWGSEGVIENCIAFMMPNAGGATGYSSAIVIREPAKNNIVRFNWLTCGNYHAILTVAKTSGTSAYCNYLRAKNPIVNAGE